MTPTGGISPFGPRRGPSCRLSSQRLHLVSRQLRSGWPRTGYPTPVPRCPATTCRTDKTDPARGCDGRLSGLLLLFARWPGRIHAASNGRSLWAVIQAAFIGVPGVGSRHGLASRASGRLDGVSVASERSWGIRPPQVLPVFSRLFSEVNGSVFGSMRD